MDRFPTLVGITTRTALGDEHLLQDALNEIGAHLASCQDVLAKPDATLEEVKEAIETAQDCIALLATMQTVYLALLRPGR